MVIVSEKRKCNFYNVGYCKNSDKGCRFVHPEESCKSENCEYKSCPKRHQKDCKYFKYRSYCKHGSSCQFKHLKKKSDSKTDTLEEKITALKTYIEEKDDVIEELKELILTLEEKIKKHEELKSKLDSLENCTLSA